jgi:hypothetical protein
MKFCNILRAGTNLASFFIALQFVGERSTLAIFPLLISSENPCRLLLHRPLH